MERIGLCFFTICAQQRAKLAVVFSAASFESPVEHFHFDETVVSDFNSISLSHFFI